MSAEFATSSSATLPLHVLIEAALEGWLADQPGPVQAWVKASGFAGALGQALVVPGEAGTPALALAGYGTEAARRRGRFHLAAAAAKLPAGDYRIESGLPEDQAANEALGWLLAGYRFDRYRDQTPLAARLVARRRDRRRADHGAGHG